METNEKDNFMFETILGEILSTEKVKFDNTDCFAINKGELNDVIVTVAEIDDKEDLKSN